MRSSNEQHHVMVFPRYRDRNGREFSLASFLPAEWGAARAAHLRSLGCSNETVNAVEAAYRTAERIN